MDPDANFRERIAILKAMRADNRAMSPTERGRFNDLTEAYAEWRASGGFPADRALRDELLTLYGAKR